jgi:hypothetical protein
VQGIDVGTLNVKLSSIEPQEQEGKAIYSLKLECHNSSYALHKIKKTTKSDLMVVSNKIINQGKQRYPILNNGEDMTKVVLLK